jgi:hypothetical protein
MATENFMCNRKSARHTSIVEYENKTVYFTKAVKYNEKQQKRIRGLPKTQFLCFMISLLFTGAKTKRLLNVRTYSRV